VAAVVAGRVAVAVSVSAAIVEVGHPRLGKTS
jgi:hypothetical protein